MVRLFLIKPSWCLIRHYCVWEKLKFVVWFSILFGKMDLTVSNWWMTKPLTPCSFTMTSFIFVFLPLYLFFLVTISILLPMQTGSHISFHTTADDLINKCLCKFTRKENQEPEFCCALSQDCCLCVALNCVLKWLAVESHDIQIVAAPLFTPQKFFFKNDSVF